MSKHPLLLFSGGLDSTYMLQCALEQGDVETLYVAANQCELKVKRELEARAKIFERLRKIRGGRVIKDHIVKVTVDIKPFSHQMPDHAWQQPLMWIHGALQVSDGYKQSELRIGYVTGDGILSKLNHMTQAWESLQAFTKHYTMPVVFPLQHFTKQNILERLDPRLWEYIWVCEMPVKKGRWLYACDKCSACHTRAKELFHFERVHEEPYTTYVRRKKKEIRYTAKRRLQEIT